MTSHDMPVHEINRLLTEDRRAAQARAWTNQMSNKPKHIHTFDQEIIGQTKTWHRCACGEWKEK